MKTTQAQTARTRQALLDAAELLFWERGAARASIVDIARTAGLTRGALYHHFKDKAELLTALIEQARAREYEPPVLSGDKADPLAVLETFSSDLLQHFAADRRQQRIFAILMQGREALGDLAPLARARREEIFRSVDAYAALFEQARLIGRLSPTWEPRIAATVLYSMMIGLLDQWVRAPDSLDIRLVGRASVAQLFAAFRAEGVAEK